MVLQQTCVEWYGEMCVSLFCVEPCCVCVRLDVLLFLCACPHILNRHREEGCSEISCKSARNAFLGGLLCACMAAHLGWE